MSDYIKQGGHGGARPGAGRKPGDNCVAEHYREQFKVLPIDYMLRVLNGIDPATGEPFTEENRPSSKRLDRLAIAAASYIHRRLAPVDIDGNQADRDTSVDLTKLTTEELKWFERILMKAQIRPPKEAA